MASCRTRIHSLTRRQKNAIVKIKDVITTLEKFAPLPLQDSYDNAGLQVGITEADCSGVLLCLDVTEPVLKEARERGCNMVVSHHPLLFHPLRHLTDATYVERCVKLAVQNDITIYSAHTNLDNAPMGVSFKMAQMLEMSDVRFLVDNHNGGGSGLVGRLANPMSAESFINKVKDVFGVECAMTNALPGRLINKVALCGGAGDFLINEAVAQDCDAFLTGEIHYHQFFGLEDKILLLAIGHYQSEQYTIPLLKSIILRDYPEARLLRTQYNTNPILYH